MISLERQIFTYFENLKNYIRVQPIVFGGVPGPSGGTGGPPGGIVGQLPQTAITLDLTEDEIWAIPPSGTSLVNNLDRIRYRLGQLEAASGGSPGPAGPGTITIMQDGAVIASGITTIDLHGTLSITTSGTVATVKHPDHASDFYTVISGTTQFTTTNSYISNSLSVYWNGIKQFNTDYTELAPGSGLFTTGFTVPSGTLVVADYLYYGTVWEGFGENPWDEGPWG